MTETVNIEIVGHGTPLYNKTVKLRYLVLRWPLGLNFTKEELMAEKDQIHFAALDKGRGRVSGCVLLEPKDPETFRLRQMAVDPTMRGKGIGSALLKAAEDWAQEKNFSRIVLHARRDAAGFYERSGYEAFGEPFIEVTVPHLGMEKHLTNM